MSVLRLDRRFTFAPNTPTTNKISVKFHRVFSSQLRSQSGVLQIFSG
jgi:hypothetical protein